MLIKYYHKFGKSQAIFRWKNITHLSPRNSSDGLWKNMLKYPGLFWYDHCKKVQKGGFPLGGNYTKSVYNQLMEVMERLDSMEVEHRKDRNEIKGLTSEVKSLHVENTRLRKEVTGLKHKNATLEEDNLQLEKENTLLRDDNERMKRTLGNDSSNLSTPLPKTRRGKCQTCITAGNLPGRKKGSSLDTRERVCQKQMWKRKSRMRFLNTASKKSVYAEGLISPVTAWI